MLGDAGGEKWFNMYKEWYSKGISSDLGAKFLVLATESLQYYTSNSWHDPWGVKKLKSSSIKKASSKNA